ncbi:MAG TPA: hypothetical protein PKY31_03590 [Spirochaetota bacterium]|nr:hypothetical protein [Spirochaetota bacterium]
MMSHIKSMVVVAGVVMLASCVTLFKPVNDKSNIKGVRLAVVPGINEKTNIMFARQFAEEFGRSTKFKVQSHADTMGRLGQYGEIQGPYRKGHIDYFDAWDKTDRAKLTDIQKRLGVDNLYVVWATREKISEQTGSKVLQVETYTQFFAFPGAVEIGQAKFDVTYAEGFVIGAKVPRNREDAIKQVAPPVVKEVAEKTGYSK